LLLQVAALAALGFCGAVQADKPPVRILVGFPAGGGTDAIARTLAEHLKDELGAPVIVENKPGAGGQLAAQALKSAAPDGTTFFISHDHTITILPLVMKNPGFDPAHDFVPVAGFATFVNALRGVGGHAGEELAEYVAWVKRRARARAWSACRRRRRRRSSWSRCSARSTSSTSSPRRTAAARR
jgi:tripartite-type tricarboxylate transporter receptor subunit TctC